MLGHIHTHTQVFTHSAIIIATFAFVERRLIVYNCTGQLLSLVFPPLSTNMAAILCYKSLIFISCFLYQIVQTESFFSLRYYYPSAEHPV